jgi:hypothetical protein
LVRGALATLPLEVAAEPSDAVHVLEAGVRQHVPEPR